jgi:hypothetical protein
MTNPAPILSAEYAGRTWTVGEVLYVPSEAITDGGSFDVQAVRVASIDRYDCPEFAIAGDHVNHRGQVQVDRGSTYWRDVRAPGFSDFDTVTSEARVVANLSGPAPTSLVRATRIVTNTGYREYAIPKGAAVHVAGDSGGPLCGSKVTAEATNSERWNPWHRHTVEADSRASVYLPSFQVPTCAKCAARGGK